MYLFPSRLSFFALVHFILPFIAASNALTILPHPNNTFLTGVKTTYLVDQNRLDPFAPSPQPRAIAVSTFYPVPNSANCSLNATPYMPPATAIYEGELYSHLYGVPNNTFSDLRLSTCQDFTAVPFPIVLFSTGLNATRFIYSYLAQAVASAGYIVVTMDHPYDTDVVEFPDGRLIFATNLTEAEVESTDVETRAADASFVLDQLSIPSQAAKIVPLAKGQRLNASRTAFYGHSLGGATVAAAMFNDSRIIGGLDMDGAIQGEVVQGGLDRPFVLFGIPNHEAVDNDLTWDEFWPNLRGERSELALNGSQHITFSDMPFVADALGFRDLLPPDVVDTLLGSIDGRRAYAVVTQYVIKFMDHVLKGLEVTGLHEPDPSFPEVSVVR